VSVLELEPPAMAPAPAPLLADVLLRALSAPESEPCPVCAGALVRTGRGAACAACGSRIERGDERGRGAWVGDPARRG
jgi:hypothetical protein